MKYIVDSTTNWYFDENNPPCEGAYPVKMEKQQVWAIEIIDLYEFVKKHGKIILKLQDDECVGFEKVMHIEIYDSYRE